jgi:DNA polymerase-1
VLEKEKPSHIAVVFDPPQETFRSQEYAAYKAHREEMPEDIRLSIPYIMRIIEGFKIPVMLVEGFEADDVVGTMAKQAEQRGFKTYMMTPDKDYGQLVSENIFIYKPGRFGNPSEILGVKDVCERFGVDRPEQVIDILGLMGDKVDNIPGIPGFGEKTAIKLINQYGSVENLIAHSAELKGKQKDLVEEHHEMAMLSKKLATIVLDVPVEFDENALILEAPDKQKLTDVFAELEFRTISKRIFNEEVSASGPAPSANPKSAASNSSQFSLFGEDGAATEEAIVSNYKTISEVEHTYILADNPVKNFVLIQKPVT